MQTFNLEYISNNQLESFVKSNNLADSNDILIQIYTAQNNKTFISNLLTSILKLIPNAKIIGSTTCGEISSRGALVNSTIISFSLFSNTTITTSLSELSTDSFTLGQNILKSFENYANEELKLLITFIDGLHSNGEDYLNGITSINENIIVSGGMAGDNSQFSETFVFTESKIINNGAVAAAFYNKNLNVYTSYSFNWETIGHTHVVTKSIKNRIYTIDHMSAVDFYKYYLSEDIGNLLPSIGIEFPLVMMKNGVKIARAVTSTHDDGSLSFAGNIPENSIIQFGYGDVKMIIDKGLDNVKRIVEHPIETIFIFSCMARHSLLKDDVNLEILPLKEIAPISGFFTYGEFFHKCNAKKCTNQLLNETMTIVAISENDNKIEKIDENIFFKNKAQEHTIELHRTQALSSLVKRTTEELEKSNRLLEHKIYKANEDYKIQEETLQILKTNAQIGDMLEMIIHQWRQPLSAITTVASSMQIYNEIGTLTDKIINQSLENILSYANNINTTIEDFRDLFSRDSHNNLSTFSTVITKSLTISNPLINNYNVKIIKEIIDDPTIFIPTGLMMQVVINIIKNAIDILVEKNIDNPTIKFKTIIKHDKLVVKIMDNAGGIPEDVLPYIFDKNFTTKGNDHGTGIGLDMSKIIMKTKIGGSLSASNQGNWAVFKIKIPLKS